MLASNVHVVGLFGALTGDEGDSAFAGAALLAVAFGGVTVAAVAFGGVTVAAVAFGRERRLAAFTATAAAGSLASASISPPKWLFDPSSAS